jgi:glycosyltransferase involved in cell wall biosynthesis
MEPLSLVIPTINEAETIGAAIREIPAAYRLNIIVADGVSTDGTRRIARIAGARVVSPSSRIRPSESPILACRL